jgi:hypothetical protein
MTRNNEAPYAKRFCEMVLPFREKHMQLDFNDGDRVVFIGDPAKLRDPVERETGGFVQGATGMPGFLWVKFDGTENAQAVSPDEIARVDPEGRGQRFVQFDRPALKRFQETYNTAVGCGLAEFTFDGNTFLATYAKYLIEHLDRALPA